MEILNKEYQGVEFYSPESLGGLDSLLDEHEIDIIILDLNFQNGALADWLSLWPLPFIIMASADDRERLSELLKDEASSFILREPNYRYIEVLPIMVNKVLSYRELQTIQNKHLRISERRYLELVQALPDIVYHIDEKGEFIYINESVRYLGFDPLELIGKHFSVILAPGEAERVSKGLVLEKYKGQQTGPEKAPKLFDERRTGERKTKNLIIKLKKNSKNISEEDFIGSVTAYGEISSAGFIFDEQEDIPRGTVGIIRDVTEKIGQERKLRDSVEEKTILLREVHHRVKNNLQIILSLMNLHCREGEGENLHYLQELEAEIHSMALVHDQLCRSDSLNRIDMQGYIRTLFERLCKIYNINDGKIQFTVSAENVSLKLDKATPVGLILNELVSNSIKHAFPEKQKGNISISFKRHDRGHFLLRVKDTGVGFKKGKDPSGKANIGLRLIELLVDQLQGKLLFSGDSEGADISIEIPEEVLHANIDC